jgi:signal transduction histidine kinase
MEQLIEELLTADTSAQERFEPAEVATSMIERLRPLAQHKGHVLAVEIEMDPEVTIIADPLLISEAMENYLSNAIKYTTHNGHIKVCLFVEDQKLKYVVEDNGIGIGAEHIPHLFEPYYRPPGTVEQGYGIGLNLVKTIVERHGGQVWVESKENVGSRFGFWLPM